MTYHSKGGDMEIQLDDMKAIFYNAPKRRIFFSEYTDGMNEAHKDYFEAKYLKIISLFGQAQRKFWFANPKQLEEFQSNDNVKKTCEIFFNLSNEHGYNYSLDEASINISIITNDYWHAFIWAEVSNFDHNLYVFLIDWLHRCSSSYSKISMNYKFQGKMDAKEIIKQSKLAKPFVKIMKQYAIW
jgi:hypothetical protein